jgi:hypothetical protein
MSDQEVTSATLTSQACCESYQEGGWILKKKKKPLKYTNSVQWKDLLLGVFQILCYDEGFLMDKFLANVKIFLNREAGRDVEGHA